MKLKWIELKKQIDKSTVGDLFKPFSQRWIEQLETNKSPTANRFEWRRPGRH